MATQSQDQRPPPAEAIRMDATGPEFAERPLPQKSRFRSPLGCFSLLIVISLLVYGGCTWDGYVADYRFEKLCSEPGAVGQFIYEQVEIGEEYLLSAVSEQNDNTIPSHLYFSREVAADFTELSQEYQVDVFQDATVSKLGPVIKTRSSVVRKLDGKLLSEAVSYKNLGGWAKRANPFYLIIERCPSSNQPADTVPAHFDIHESLVRNTFLIKPRRCEHDHGQGQPISACRPTELRRQPRGI